MWIYVNSDKAVGDPDHLKVFASELAAVEWFRDNDPEGVAFEYPVHSETGNSSMRIRIRTHP
ncbi:MULTISPECIES: hypothetical protein [unclassified Bradyrhizobium]|uniref:hypothetical protein n=1 Tax=unclassified Bradyrhizobium TaxID=2631580 RepID=UPI0020137E70|nr:MULTISPECIES: hypothetical protein [unclassified Bradyrhizobium]